MNFLGPKLFLCCCDIANVCWKAMSHSNPHVRGNHRLRQSFCVKGNVEMKLENGCCFPSEIKHQLDLSDDWSLCCNASSILTLSLFRQNRIHFIFSHVWCVYILKLNEKKTFYPSSLGTCFCECLSADFRSKSLIPPAENTEIVCVCTIMYFYAELLAEREYSKTLCGSQNFFFDEFRSAFCVVTLFFSAHLFPQPFLRLKLFSRPTIKITFCFIFQMANINCFKAPKSIKVLSLLSLFIPRQISQPTILPLAAQHTTVTMKLFFCHSFFTLSRVFGF